MKPKVHAEMIKAWADGYEIEVFIPEQDRWVDVEKPEWYENMEYRVKPGVIESPRVTIRYACIDVNPFTNEIEITENNPRANNVVLTFVGDDLDCVCMIEDLSGIEDDVPW